MSLDRKSKGGSRGVQEIDGVLRYPDGSADIAAYAKLAHRERDAAIAGSARKGIRLVRELWSVVWTSVAPIARSELPAGKHPARAGR
jgi:hypothetical protein